MNNSEIVDLVNADPVIQALLEAPVPMRLAYVGLDGHPRSIPVAYLWNGKAFVVASPTTAYKVKAITAHPEVSFTIDIGPGQSAADVRAKVVAQLGPTVAPFTPLIVLGRGTASIEVAEGVAQEHVDGSRRLINDDAQWKEWERLKREEMVDMAVIAITPTHITVADFITRFPPPAEINAPAHGAGKEPRYGAPDSPGVSGG